MAGQGGRRHSRVPVGRIERVARIGWLAGEIALGGAAESIRRLAGGARGASQSVFVSSGNAGRLARRLSSMRGAAMKLGQLLSMEAEDLLPAEVADALAVLRADGDSMPPAQLRGALREAYGHDWQTRFREFDFDPIAAASIGQVHRAVARDGRDLALKVQYPGVAESIESDVENLATALRISRILPRDADISDLIAEAKRGLQQEADYRREAQSLRRYAELLGGDREFAIPGVHDDLTTSGILAMDRVPGLPLEDLCGPEHSPELRDHAATALLGLVLRELFAFRFVQTDPNFANYLWIPEQERIGLLDLGAAREISTSLSCSYARLIRAGMRGDRQALGHVAVEMKLLPPDESAERRAALLDLLELATEPFRHRGPYDFGVSDLPLRAREAATRLAFRHGLRNPPPPDVLFVQRKIGGTFLLCARLRARVDARGLAERMLTAD